MKRIYLYFYVVITWIFFAPEEGFSYCESGGGVAIGYDCNGFSTAGCCDLNHHVLYWCENINDVQVLCKKECGEGSFCKWKTIVEDVLGEYVCGNEFLPEPSGKYPVICLAFCEPDCKDKKCGDDGCGGVCGTCYNDTICQNGKCVQKCSCEGKECGDDGCGGICGFCEAPFECIDGKCVCHPDCTGKECGDDGCGGTCGSCPEGKICKEGACTTVLDSYEPPAEKVEVIEEKDAVDVFEKSDFKEDKHETEEAKNYYKDAETDKTENGSFHEISSHSSDSTLFIDYFVQKENSGVNLKDSSDSGCSVSSFNSKNFNCLILVLVVYFLSLTVLMKKRNAGTP